MSASLVITVHINFLQVTGDKRDWFSWPVLTMKSLVVLLELITATLLPGNWGIGRRWGRAGTRSDCGVLSIHLTGVAAVTVRISAYNATGELDIRRDPFTLGTRVLLTCDVTELPEGNETLNYRWYNKCPELPNSRCEIRDGDPYYRVVSDTLLVDVTSHGQGGRYYCTVHGLQEIQTATTPELSVAGYCTQYIHIYILTMCLHCVYFFGLLLYMWRTESP